MIKLLLLVALACWGWKALSGRWPWEPKGGLRAQKVGRAHQLLGTRPGASREQILDAHRRLITQVHPDRGGSNLAVHEANDARDLLLADLPNTTSGA